MTREEIRGTCVAINCQKGLEWFDAFVRKVLCYNKEGKLRVNGQTTEDKTRTGRRL